MNPTLQAAVDFWNASKAATGFAPHPNDFERWLSENGLYFGPVGEPSPQGSIANMAWRLLATLTDTVPPADSGMGRELVRVRKWGPFLPQTVEWFNDAGNWLWGGSDTGRLWAGLYHLPPWLDDAKTLTGMVGPNLLRWNIVQRDAPRLGMTTEALAQALWGNQQWWPGTTLLPDYTLALDLAAPLPPASFTTFTGCDGNQYRVNSYELLSHPAWIELRQGCAVEVVEAPETPSISEGFPVDDDPDPFDDDLGPFDDDPGPFDDDPDPGEPDDFGDRFDDPEDFFPPEPPDTEEEDFPLIELPGPVPSFPGDSGPFPGSGGKEPGEGVPTVDLTPGAGIAPGVLAAGAGLLLIFLGRREEE